MRGGRSFAALASAAAIGAAWAQADKPLDLRLPPPDAPSAAGSVCKACGEIKSIREVHVGPSREVQTTAQTESVGSRPGTDDWLVVGPVVYLPLGAKTDGGWRVGAMGTPEMQGQFGQSTYEISLLMDSGERRAIQRRDGSRFRVGQRVTLRSGEIEPMFP